MIPEEGKPAGDNKGATLGSQLFLRAISWERRETELLAALARPFLHTSVEPKYCFSSYIVTIKTELEEWCQSPLTSSVEH